MPSKTKRLLIIFPYGTIDTNPTMCFLLEMLAERRVETDVLCVQDPSFLSPEVFGDTIRLRYLPSSFYSINYPPHRLLKLIILPIRLSAAILRGISYQEAIERDPMLFRYLKAREYNLVIGVDPYGIRYADMLSSWVQRPFVYINFELMFADELVYGYEIALKKLEIDICRRTPLVMLPDEERAQVFCQENNYPREHVVLVPVAPAPQQIQKTNYLHNSLGIPSGRRIVLYIGNLVPWYSRDELAELVSFWPERFCLVIHHNSKVNARMQKYFENLLSTGKILITYEPVSRKQLANLVCSADYGLATYKPSPDIWESGKNIYHLGLSSGKVSFYAMCGLPILARSLPVFEREIKNYQFGKIFNKLSESGTLLEEMESNYQKFRNESLRFYQEKLNPIPGMNVFCDSVIKLMEQSEPHFIKPK